MIIHGNNPIQICSELLGDPMESHFVCTVIEVGVGYARFCLVAKIVNYKVLG